VSASEETLIQFLKDKAEAAWADAQPYLLSFAGPDLTEAKIDYRGILGGEKLKAFAERTQGADRYRVVKHPHQRAKVGLLKHDEEFTFDLSEERPARAAGTWQPQGGAPLTSFINALTHLSAEDLEDFVIPARVLVKLAQKR